MYGPQVKSATVGAGVLLPATGSNRPLFYAAATLFVAGLVVMAVSAFAARRARKVEASA